LGAGAATWLGRRIWMRWKTTSLPLSVVRSMIAASVMLGAAGTLLGLVKAFGALSGESVDPSQKARILAEGISEAMNCTALGFMVAIIGLIGFAVLNGKTQQLEDDINEASVQVLNLVVSNRQKVNLAGVQG